MLYSNVYIETKEIFSSQIDSKEFYFTNVVVINDNGHITIFEINSANMLFRCSLDNIDKYCVIE